MAPVGSRESLAAALAAGADAIYFGIEGLNMRSRSSSNFTLDDLREIAATCNAAGVKTYLTVNTIIYDSDMERMRSIVDAARQAGISAIIASDIAVIAYANAWAAGAYLDSGQYQQYRGCEILCPIRRRDGARPRTIDGPGG